MTHYSHINITILEKLRDLHTHVHQILEYTISGLRVIAIKIY